MSYAPPTLSGSVAQSLAQAIQGGVVDRTSPDYEACRRALIWNGRPPERFPDIIAKPRTAEDVTIAVKVARKHGLRVSVRGSGHSYSGIFLCEGGLLLDLSELNDIVVDRELKRVSVGPGATSGKIDAALEPYGLAFPVGHGGPVGIAGFLLGGGLGINSTAWGGVSTFNIRCADVVTADGDCLRVSADENPDLYWAMRGGGPGLPFIVVRFNLNCYDRPPCVTINNYFVRFSQLSRLAEIIEDAAGHFDHRFQLMLGVVPIPSDFASLCDESDHGWMGALTAIAFGQNAEDARTLHAPLFAHMDSAEILHRQEIQGVRFADMFAMTDALIASSRVRADNIMTDDVVGAVKILMRHMPSCPSTATTPLILWRGAHKYPDAAFSIAGRFSVSTYAQWDRASEDAANASWLGELFSELSSIATGAYINEADLEGRPGIVSECHSDHSRKRMEKLRKDRDPDGVFQYPLIK